MSRRQSQVSTKVREDAHGVTSAHPAFGNVTVVQWHGGGGEGDRLCGSDLRHNTGIRIAFHIAEHHRGLSYDRWPGRELLLEVDMSQAQWARFVASQGNGDGLPCTVRYRRTGALEQTPSIAQPEASKREVFGEEMAGALRERLEAITEQVDRLGRLIEGGGGKKELRAVHAELARHADQLPGSVQFVHHQFARSTEKMSQDAMTEVEGYVMGMAQRLGIQRLADAFPELTSQPREGSLASEAGGDEDSTPKAQEPGDA